MPAWREREGREDADGVQRDQGVGDAAEGDDAARGRARRGSRIAVREHQAVAPVRELAGQVAVAGDDRREAREVGVGRVGGQRRGWPRWRTAGSRRAARRRTRAGPSARAPSRRGSGTGCRWCARSETPKKSVAEDDRHPRRACCAAFFDSGVRNAGTPSEIASTPVRATAPDEKPLRMRNSPSVPPVSRRPRTPPRRRAPCSMSPKKLRNRPYTISTARMRM